MFTITTLAPAGVEQEYERVSPKKKHTTDSMADEIVTERKVLNTLMDESGGKIKRLDISSAPSSRIPSTIVIAVSTAMTEL